MAPPRKVIPTPKKNPLKGKSMAIRKTPNAPPNMARSAPRPAPIVRLTAPKAKGRRVCTNKMCVNPKIEDGVCQSCGTMVDESTIVAEIQFGESSSGAAVVQGSFVQEGQGGARSMGPRGMSSGGQENKEKTEKEGKRLMAGFAAEHQLPESAVMRGMMVFKLAASRNFVQGRTVRSVAAVCLYSACRNQRPCKIMLIDLADSCQINVFKLGRCYKALTKCITINQDAPIMPEDLIWRFASKLEFGTETDKVAESAIRLVNRMKLDWMVAGRRPNGICGACLILAARMHNFRRTTTEVVYVVKVTTATLQQRLDEFGNTPSSAMTVEDFLASDFLESSHDPPSYYKNTEAWKKSQASRKRKRGSLVEEREHDGAAVDPGAVPSGSEQASATLEAVQLSAAIADGQALPISESTGTSAMPPPPRPQELQSDSTPSIAVLESQIDPALLEDTENDRAMASLVAQHGDRAPPTLTPPATNPETTIEQGDAVPKRGPGRPPKNPAPPTPSVVDAAWEADEADIEAQISEMISDPHTVEHTTAFASAEQRARITSMLAFAKDPQIEIPESSNIEEGEFADDPEVLNCLLSEQESAIKERIWINNNKDWLREQQAKEFRAKIAAMGPPKARRNRTKKARIGEFQTEAAGSPADAAVSALKERAFSKRINYDAIQSVFGPRRGVLGSESNSRATSRAGSVAPSSIVSTGAESVAGSVAGGSVVDENESVTGADNTVMSDDEPYHEDVPDEGLGPDDNWRNDFGNDDIDEY